tara:strand:- start:89796 stop:90293 length:498 start_codon:yes stop_codon:yes gene_type:complete
MRILPFRSPRSVDILVAPTPGAYESHSYVGIHRTLDIEERDIRRVLQNPTHLMLVETLSDSRRMSYIRDFKERIRRSKRRVDDYIGESQTYGHITPTEFLEVLSVVEARYEQLEADVTDLFLPKTGLRSEPEVHESSDESNKPKNPKHPYSQEEDDRPIHLDMLV